MAEEKTPEYGDQRPDGHVRDDRDEMRQEVQNSMTLLSVRDFMAKLSGRDPVPGGGGASAVAAALGAALGSMTAALAVGKKRYADSQEALEKLTEQFHELIQELLACVDRDAENFLPLLSAYGLPHSTPEETKAREEAVGAALAKASEVPLCIMRLCLQALRLLDEAEEKGSRMAVSDAGAGVKLTRAALEAASLNVYINAKAMKDRETASRQREEADKMVREGKKLSDEIYGRVLKEIRG